MATHERGPRLLASLEPPAAGRWRGHLLESEPLRHLLRSLTAHPCRRMDEILQYRQQPKKEQSEEGDPLLTRFVTDIISGSSARGTHDGASRLGGRRGEDVRELSGPSKGPVKGINLSRVLSTMDVKEGGMNSEKR